MPCSEILDLGKRVFHRQTHQLSQGTAFYSSCVRHQTWNLHW